MKTSRKIIAIVGPTASGKTAVGVKLAKEFNGEIVSADSRQIFRGLDLGTGKEGSPCQQETIIKKQDTNNQQYNNITIQQLRHDLRCIDGIPQWVIDVAEPEENFNLFKYLELAREAIEDIFSRRKLPIIVGGTGLYVQALIEGFQLEKSEASPSRHPEFISGSHNEEMLKREQIPKQVRDDTKASVKHDKIDREQLEKSTVSELQAILQEIDSKAFDDMADQKNPHRLIRAIERAQEGTEMKKDKPDWDALQIGIEWPREIINKRIDKRIDDRFDDGMLEEVIGLIRSGVDPEWLMKLGLEYREITSYLQQIAILLNCHIADLDNITIQQYNNEFELMRNQLKLRSHQYAKRQMTWFKRFPEIVWLSDYKDIEKKVKEYLD